MRFRAFDLWILRAAAVIVALHGVDLLLRSVPEYSRAGDKFGGAGLLVLLADAHGRRRRRE